MAQNIETFSNILKHVKVILLDIEGTTTPIKFVVDILFPYAKDNLLSFLQCKFETTEVSQIIKALTEQYKEDKASGMAVIPEISGQCSNKQEVLSFVNAYVKWQMQLNRKTTALKKLQGKIWKNAYETGEIKGQVYDDVLLAFKHWKATGKKLCIYSSGSIEAQKLLFGYSANGNLLEFLDKHFDTTIGDKKHTDSYKKIADTLEVEPPEVLFLTDVAYEADAALTAGMKAIIVVRPGNKPIDDPTKYICIENFLPLLTVEK